MHCMQHELHNKLNSVQPTKDVYSEICPIDTYVIYQGFFSEIDQLSIVNHKFSIHPLLYANHHGFR